MNHVSLIGNVATATTLDHTPDGHARCTFRIAVDRPHGRDSDADFFTVTCWRRQAEVAHQHLAVGSRIGLTGRLRHTTWTTADGPRHRTEVIAQSIHFLDPAPPAN